MLYNSFHQAAGSTARRSATQHSMVWIKIRGMALFLAIVRLWSPSYTGRPRY